MDQQIAALGAQIAELRQSAKTNETLMAEQKSEIANLQTATEGLTNQVAEYKKAVGTFEAKLKEAYDGINKQNDAMHELVAQRDEFSQGKIMQISLPQFNGHIDRHPDYYPTVWLGNDETHYERRWKDKDLDDLKVMINSTTSAAGEALS